MSYIKSRNFVGTMLEVLLKAQGMTPTEFCKEFHVSPKTMVGIKKMSILF